MAAAKTQLVSVPGRLITQRNEEALVHLHIRVSRMASRLYSRAAKEEREKVDPFYLRILRVASNISGAWGGLVALPEVAREFVIADYRADFDEATATLESLVSRLLHCTVDLEAGQPVHDEVLSALTAMEETTRSLMALGVNPRYFYDNAPAEEIVRVGLQHVLTADFMLQSFARIMAYAVSLRLGLESLRTELSEEGAMDDAERARRYRARKRRRVAFQAVIDVYEDDLTLLRQFGFLSPSESEDRELVTKEMETFLLHAFLTYPHSPRPWRERIGRQKGRMSALGPDHLKSGKE